jgi:heme o synthase
VLRHYLKLTKPGLNLMVVLTTLAGYLAAGGGVPDAARLAWTLGGTALAALGSSGVNQWLERRRDARMLRTRSRPLPSGALPPTQALVVALLLACSGDIFLGVAVNTLTAALAIATQLIYLCAYTPLKARTPLSTLLGAVCGALPPMMGFSAATGGLPIGAWILGALLFAWQMPHSLALGWMYREDYRRGGYRLLPVLDSSGQRTFITMLLYSLSLLPLALALTLSGTAGWVYGAGSLALGLALSWQAMRLLASGSDQVARRMFLASVSYLPLLLLLLMLDVRPQERPVPPVTAQASAVSASYMINGE